MSERSDDGAVAPGAPGGSGPSAPASVSSPLGRPSPSDEADLPGSSGAMDGWPTGRLLATAARLVEHGWHDALDTLGLTHAGLITLHFLGAGPMSQTELARRARVETQTMSRTLERLERAGCVTREADAADRRRHVVRLTDQGRTTWARARSLEADVFPDVTDHEGLRRSLLEIISTSTDHRWPDRTPEP